MEVYISVLFNGWHSKCKHIYISNATHWIKHFFIYKNIQLNNNSGNQMVLSDYVEYSCGYVSYFCLFLCMVMIVHTMISTVTTIEKKIAGGETKHGRKKKHSLLIFGCF